MLRALPFLLLLLLAACVSHTGVPPSVAAAPAAASSGIDVERNLAYATAGGAQAADLYKPRTTTPWPAIVLVHGGGWVRGSRGRVGSWRKSPPASIRSVTCSR